MIMKVLASRSFSSFKLNIGTRLGLSYGLITCVLVGLSGYTVQSMNRLSLLTNQLYDHPFTVSTTVLKLESTIVKMHRSMKDVALANSEAEIDAAADQVDQLEVEVLDEFTILFDRFLGDASEIEALQRNFVGWKPIRDRVIQLRKAGQIAEAAAITKGEGAIYVNELLDDTQAFTDFANNKAQEFVEDAERQRLQSLRWTVGLVLMVVVVAATLAVVTTRSITRSLREAIALNDRLASGDLNVSIGTNRQDEIGQLLTSMDRMVRQLQGIVSRVKRSSEAVFARSQGMSASATQMSSGAAEQAAATQQASKSIEHMIETIQANTNHAEETQAIASQAATDAETTRHAILAVIEVMHTIIQKISVVEEIALQTNMLALNASIEAARSQDGTNGFKVVALEIRKLAERTRNAAADINQLAGSSVSSVSQAETMLNQLMPSIQNTATFVQKISNGSREQLQGSTQINQAIGQLDLVTQQNSEVASLLFSTAQDLAEQATELQAAIAFFQIQSAR
ncbi:methyl-accepting chemotaxis protein [Spirulina major CS-329]|uniref:methyl-accepting chemotaxis protein n=1 Tax=Spirulina TaxID=1154 RepID=UPI00232C011F|nr:methyl-accepting chemotaxis protein [Spirulina major]MDB9493191.1 methyl-accepting chemotaxis protein [Spirulina subsalsa CS-330]MDB9501971.1 methyl-accepting chemotaxis protein [Spirulina major CS-329]